MYTQAKSDLRQLENIPNPVSIWILALWIPHFVLRLSLQINKLK